MKGRNTFTSSEKDQLEELIKRRTTATKSEQKGIRAKMRRLDFYGRDDFDIVDLQLADFQNLIDTGQIIITDEVDAKPKLVKKVSKPATVKPSVALKPFDGTFSKFDPLKDDNSILPDEKGNYLFCLRKGTQLPKATLPFKTKRYGGLEVIYTGLTTTSLRSRDGSAHFNGNASNSTLRKSIGVLFGYELIVASVTKKGKVKTKFSLEDEAKLSQWMKQHLMLFYSATPNPKEVEDQLIAQYNPPLNLRDNNNTINQEYRDLIKELRN